MAEKTEYTIKVKGQLVPVTKDVYLTYYRSKRRERYYERDIKVDRAVCDENGNIIEYKPAKEDSFDSLIESGEEYADDRESVEDSAITSVMIEKLNESLNLLPDDERKLIEELFYSNDGEGMSEREYADKFGIAKSTLHDRKSMIFAKLLENLEKK